MSVSALSCQTYAGGFDVGAVQAGLKLIGHVEAEGGFGLANCEANRHILGNEWKGQVGKPETWEPVPADVIIANPPCSAFSSMAYGARGMVYGVENKINQCMWNMIDYAGKVKPQMVIMESVQGAAVAGTPLMRRLRDKLEQLTGKKYWLVHVLQNNAALGGGSNRRRYFMVLSQVPFGVDLPNFNPPPVLREVIGGLEGLDPYIYGAQEYPDGIKAGGTVNPRAKFVDSEWAQLNVVNPAGTVDGHSTVPTATHHYQRAIDLMDEEPIDEEGGTWPQGRCMVVAMRRYYVKHGKLPERWHTLDRRGRWVDEAYIDVNMEMGWNRPKRWHNEKVPLVITGAAMYYVLHPTQRRFLTHRECARILGFPDAWLIAPNQHDRDMPAWWGKGTSTHPAKWISGWAKRCIEGNPGSYFGTPMVEHPRLAKHGEYDREYVIDASRIPRMVQAQLELPFEESSAA